MTKPRIDTGKMPVSDSCPSAMEVKSLIADITDNIEALMSHVEIDSEATRYFELPVISSPKHYDHVKVAAHSGQAAVSRCIDSFTDFTRRDKQAPTYSYRHPGIVFINSLPVGSVDNINRQKDQLASLLSSMQGVTRSKFMRAVLPNLSTHYLTRHITALRSTPRKISFTWAGHTTISQSITMDEAIAMILARTGLDYLGERHARMLAGVTGDLHIRRPQAPHPRVNIQYAKGGKTLMLPAALPLLLQCQTHDCALTLRDLPDFTSGHRKGYRKDRRELHPVLEEFNLYETINHG